MVGCHDCAAGGVSLDASRTPRFRRVLWLALTANLAMFAVETVASFWGDSVALQADALDFLGDSVNYGISLFVLGMSLRARASAALFKGLTMAVFGIWVVFSAVERALTGSAPDPLTMGSIATVALLVNVGVALLLYTYRTGDSNMRSIWLCSRNDAIGNVAVMLAASGVWAFSTRWPDLLVATLIASLSLSAAVQIVRQASAELRDAKQAACDADATHTA